MNPSRKWLQRLLTLCLLVLVGVPFWHALFPAIHSAARDGDTGAIRRLLERNPGLATNKNFQGATPLHFAGREGHVAAAELLLSRGASINERDGSGQTAIHWATTADHPDVADLLIRRGADVNIKSSASGWTPLHLAAKLGRKRIAELLIAAGAGVELKDNYGSPPAKYAANDEIRALLKPASR